MRILIDTNVMLDIFQKREPFFLDSYQALHKAIEAESECLVSASSVTDIFYILRKFFKSADEAKERIKQLSQLVIFADVQGMDIQTALMRTMPDFEDAVVDTVAERNCVSYILTRNTKDFTGSVVPAFPSSFDVRPELRKNRDIGAAIRNFSNPEKVKGEYAELSLQFEHKEEEGGDLGTVEEMAKREGVKPLKPKQSKCMNNEES